jgi:hypothetical protein
MHKILQTFVLLFLGFFHVGSFGQTGKNYSCSYKVADLGNETNLTFTLPDNYEFGTLIPAELRVKNDPGSRVQMNTVVLKDRPYMVLSDVYKMQSKTSSMALMVFSPDGGSIDVAFINMGEKPSARFFSGKCSIN